MVIADPLERQRLGAAAAGLGTETPPWLNDDSRRTLHTILEQRLLTPVFQPILDFRARSYFGFEGLIRGPLGIIDLPYTDLKALHKDGRH